MTAEHVHKINLVAIGSGIVTIITILTFFFVTSGSFVLAKRDIDDLKEFKDKQEVINTINIEDISKIGNDIDGIKSYLKENLR